MVVATTMGALNATGLGKQEVMSDLGGDSELERAVIGLDDSRGQQLVRNEFLFGGYQDSAM